MLKFSVLMSLYFKENPIYLKIALESIFNQTLSPDQVVLVLDGPISEKLQTIVNEFQLNHSSLEIYPQDINRGLSTALNIGLSKCRNEIVFRMDTDDICYPNRFQRMMSLFEEDQKLDLAGSFATMIDENGNYIKSMSSPISEQEIYSKVWTCPFIHPTVAFKKSSIQRIGSYNPNSGPRQDDYELWFRCVAGGLHCMNLNESLLYYRFFSESVQRNNVKVGWWRFKVGFKGSLKCKCSLIAYFGVAYPLFRSIMPQIIREKLYKISDKVNPRTK